VISAACPGLLQAFFEMAIQPLHPKVERLNGAVPNTHKQSPCQFRIDPPFCLQTSDGQHID